jgi:hypothetical protein
MKKLLTWHEVEWSPEYIYADGKNESSYSIHKETFELIWATRTGRMVIGHHSNMDDAKAAAQVHAES